MNNTEDFRRMHANRIAEIMGMADQPPLTVEEAQAARGVDLIVRLRIPEVLMEVALLRQIATPEEDLVFAAVLEQLVSDLEIAEQEIDLRLPVRVANDL